MKVCILSSFEDSMKKEIGGSVRIFNVAKGLVENGNKVQVVMPSCNEKSGFLAGIEVYYLRGFIPISIFKIIKNVVNIGRTSALYFFDLLFAYRLRYVLYDSDVIQIEQQSSGALLVPFIKRVLKKPVVMDCHDVFQALRVQNTSMVRKFLETFLEKLTYKHVDLVLTVSEKEKNLLKSMGFSKKHIEVIPNGVDTDSILKCKVSDEVKGKYGIDDSKVVVFVGNLAYPPNREAIQLLSSVVAPKVLEKNKKVSFLIVGKFSGIKLPKLSYVGFVDNLSEILSISDLAVAPLFHGSGTRLKILEYFSCSLPVVSTSIGAEGIETKNGFNIFIEDDLNLFSNRIIKLLENDELAKNIGKNARLLATSIYDWKKITKDLEQCYLSMLKQADNI